MPRSSNPPVELSNDPETLYQILMANVMWLNEGKSDPINYQLCLAVIKKLTKEHLRFFCKKISESSKGNNPLFILARHGGSKGPQNEGVATDEYIVDDAALIREMIKGRVPVDIADKDGTTAIMVAAGETNSYTLAALLALKARVNQVQTGGRGLSALEFATLKLMYLQRNGKPHQIAEANEVINELRSKGASMSMADVVRVQAIFQGMTNKETNPRSSLVKRDKYSTRRSRGY